jgi:hypothetical protein
MNRRALITLFGGPRFMSTLPRPPKRQDFWRLEGDGSGAPLYIGNLRRRGGWCGELQSVRIRAHLRSLNNP